MSLKQWHGILPRAFRVLIASHLLCGIALAQTPAEPSPTTKAWTVRRPTTLHRLPLARLVRNPEEGSGGPKYALADQAGNIQRYVEPVPGIDLEPYVGYAVQVRHDTGRTLLASQLLLPGQEPESILGDTTVAEDVPTTHAESLLRGLIEAPDPMASSTPAGGSTASSSSDPTWQSGGSGVQLAQYVQNPGAPVYIQQGVPMQRQMVMQPQMPVQQGAAPMMGPQGMVNYDPAMPGAPIYLDGPLPCGPQGCPCPQPQMVMQPCPQPVAPCPPPPQPKRWAIWGEALWLQPTGIDMAHAQQQDGLGGAGTVPFGNIGVVDPGYEVGFRAGAQIRFSPKGAVFGQYTWFTSSADDSLDAPTIGGGGGAVGSLVHHPGASLTASAGPVNATYDVDFQLADLAYRYFVSCSRTGEVSVFAGGRWGKLTQDFSQNGIFGGGAGGAIDTTTNIDFNGGGPFAGIAAEHLIDSSRFSVYGKGLVAALTGTFDSHYQMFNDTTDTTLAISNWSDDRIVPMLEYELGIKWTGPQNHWRLALGYMASYWFNIVSTPTFVDAVQADNYVNVSDTVAFDGAVGRVEFRW